jgi:predicted branched-subunit amino acid permease
MTTVAAGLELRGSGAVSDGLKQMFPVAVGVLPFATMIGVAIGNSPLSQLGGWLSGLVVSGGSAHLAITASLTVGASFVATVLTALIINSRTLIYGALLGPALRDQPRWFKWVAAYALVDQLYALVSTVTDQSAQYVRHYYLAAMSILWSAYMLGVGAGVVLGPVIPSSWPLGLAVPIMFLAMLVPSMPTRPAQVAAVAALAAAMAGTVLPAGVGMIIAIGVGTAAGAIAEARSRA